MVALCGFVKPSGRKLLCPVLVCGSGIARKIAVKTRGISKEPRGALLLALAMAEQRERERVLPVLTMEIT